MRVRLLGLVKIEVFYVVLFAMHDARGRHVQVHTYPHPTLRATFSRWEKEMLASLLRAAAMLQGQVSVVPTMH
ncbi:hypothetical protein FE36_05035 [Xanthomonas oryzae pv. oryzicola]|nr:hypothetical protein FE36_05035 [Xanthomonas oryzae pv. oryzicola]